MTTTTIAPGANSFGVLPHCSGNGYQRGSAGSGSGAHSNGSITAGATAIGPNNIEALSYATDAFPIIPSTQAFVFALAGTVAQNYISSIGFTDITGAHTFSTTAPSLVFDTTSFPGFSYWVWPVSVLSTLPNPTVFTILTVSFAYDTAPVLQANDVEFNFVSLLWTPARDTTGAHPDPVQYLVFRGGTQIGTTNGATAYVDSTVAPNTSYDYTVAAGDGSGNQASGLSNDVNVTTLSIPTVSVFGGYVPPKNFKPVLLANSKGIMPRVYTPLENTTIRSK